MKTHFILLIFFFYSFLAKEPFLNFQQPVKPFISVLSPDSLKQFDQVPNKNQYKNLQKEKIDSLSNSYHELMEPFIFYQNILDKDWISYSVKCMLVDDYNLYDISSATHKKYFTEEINKTTFENNTQIGDPTKINVSFNLCYDIKPEGAEEKNQIFVDEGQQKKPITNQIGKGNQWKIVRNNDTSEIQIKVKSESKKKIFYRLICDKNAEKIQLVEEESYYHISNKEETMVITLKTEDACSKYDFYSVWKFINDYEGVFATILAIFGLFICFAGQKYSKLTSFLLTVFVVAFFILFYSQFILPSGCAEWKIWIVLTFAIILGIVAGYFVFKYHDKIFALLVGGFAGFFLGEFCFNLFGSEIDANQTLIHILFIIGCILISVAIAYYARKFIIIIATSFIGAYAFIRAISIFAGGFPSEYTVMDLKDNDEDDQLRDLLTWKVYVYLVFIVILFGLGIFIQFKLNRKAEAKKKEENENTDKNLS